MEKQSSASLQKASIHSQEEDAETSEVAPAERSPDPALIEAFAYGYSEYSYDMSIRSLDLYQGLLTIRAPLKLAETVGNTAGLVDKLYMRRDQLEHRAVVAILAWVKRFVLDVPVDSVYDALTNLQDKNPQASILALLMAVLTQFPDLAREIKAIVADAHSQATAEGNVSAGSILNQHKGIKVPNLADTHKAELAKAKKSDAYWRGSDTTIAQILNGLAGDLVIHIGALQKTDANEDKIKMTIPAIVKIGAGAAFYMGSSVHSFYAAAQLRHVRDAGDKVDFITAGDSRVCVTCLNAEDGNPWTTSTVPAIPQHGSCRCLYAPAGAIT